MVLAVYLGRKLTFTVTLFGAAARALRRVLEPERKESLRNKRYKYHSTICWSTWKTYESSRHRCSSTLNFGDNQCSPLKLPPIEASNRGPRSVKHERRSAGIRVGGLQNDEKNRNEFVVMPKYILVYIYFPYVFVYCPACYEVMLGQSGRQISVPSAAGCMLSTSKCSLSARGFHFRPVQSWRDPASPVHTCSGDSHSLPEYVPMMVTSRVVIFVKPLLVIRTACIGAHIQWIDDKRAKNGTPVHAYNIRPISGIQRRAISNS